MNTTNAVFSTMFGKKSQTNVKMVTTSNVVIYTRVSSKEQADKNLSLETQRKAIEEYAKRHNLNIAAFFGGTYESAKTDGRKEFNRMLDYVRKSNGRISKVLVYTLDRFSRTGGAAIKLATDLREKYGIAVFAVTQPTDTSNPSGVLHQNIQLLFSEYDNQLRKQKAIAGIIEKLKLGIWVQKPPVGYDIVRINSERKIVVNEDGKKLKMAFEWKLQGFKNEEILQKLRAMGMNLLKQRIFDILNNPFYCGLLSHRLLNGQIIDGKHEPIVSKENFLKIHNLLTSSTQYGVPHIAENNNLPLKVFAKCSECGNRLQAYLMKVRNIYYYKCRTKGCQCNKNADDLNNLFIKLLKKFRVKESLKSIIISRLENTLNGLISSHTEQIKTIKARLTEVTKKIDLIEEKFFVMGEMSKETYEKFNSKYKMEQEEIMIELNNCQNPISNNKNILNRVIYICDNMHEMWASGSIRLKEKLQQLVFPEGIVFDGKTQAVRTIKTNSVFAAIAQPVGSCEDKKNRTDPFLSGQSGLVGVR